MAVPGAEQGSAGQDWSESDADLGSAAVETVAVTRCVVLSIISIMEKCNGWVYC